MQEMQEMPVQSLGWEDSLEEEMAPHSSLLAWKIPWWAAVHGASKSRTWQRDWAHTYIWWFSCWVVSDSFNLPGSSIHRIFQVRILEWVAISFSRRSSWPRFNSYIAGRFFTNWATREASHTHTHTHTHILLHGLFHYGLSQSTDYSSLCYTVLFLWTFCI